MTVLQGSVDQARGGRKAEGEPPQKKTAARKAPPKKARTSVGSQRGTGKSELRQLSKAQLYERATEYDIAGRSKVSRDQLIDALARSGRRRRTNAA